MKSATAEYVSRLKAIQTERTKAGDLDGAIRVKEMIAGAEGEAEEPSGTASKEIAARLRLSNAITGRVWTNDPGSGGWSESFMFKADGFVYMPASSTKPTMRWSAISADSVVTVNGNEVVDVFTFSADRKKANTSSMGIVNESKFKWSASTKSK